MAKELTLAKELTHFIATMLEDWFKGVQTLTCATTGITVQFIDFWFAQVYDVISCIQKLDSKTVGPLISELLQEFPLKAER